MPWACRGSASCIHLQSKTTPPSRTPQTTIPGFLRQAPELNDSDDHVEVLTRGDPRRARRGSSGHPGAVCHVYGNDVLHRPSRYSSPDATLHNSGPHGHPDRRSR
jgi:hypothetical protein